MSRNIKILLAIAAAFFLIGCNTTCEQEYLRFYEKNMKYFVQQQQEVDGGVLLKYLPYGILPQHLQTKEQDIFFYLIELTGTGSADYSPSDVAFKSDSIFYLKDIGSGEMVFPDFVQPEITGLKSKARFMIGFSRDIFSNKNFSFNIEDVYFSNVLYSFPIEKEKLQLLENRYCIRYDQE